MAISLRRVSAGLLAIVSGRAIIAVGNIVLVPLYLLYWSPVRYGEWLAMSALVSYLATLDLGMNMAAVNRLTQAYARNEMGDYTESQSTAMAFYLGVAGIGTVILSLVVWTIPIPALLGLKETTRADASTVALLLALLLLWSMPCGLVTATYRTTGDLARSQWAANLQQLVAMLLIALALTQGGGPRAVALVQLVALFAITGPVVWDLRRRVPSLTPHLRRPSPTIFRSLFGAGLLFVLIIAANAISVQGGVTVVSVALGGGAVALFVATRTLTNLVRQIVGSIVNTLWPQITQLETRGELSQLRVVHRFLVVSSTALCAGFAAALWFEGADMLRVWTLGALQPDTVLLRLMLLVTILQSPWLASVMFGIATSQHARVSLCMLISSSVAVGVAAVLVRPLGSWAVPAGLLVGEGAACYHFVIKHTCHLIGEPYGPFARRLWAGVAAVTATALAVGWAVHSIAFGPMPVRWLTVGLMTVLASLGSAWGLWLKKEERAKLWRRMRPRAMAIARA
jgi:O-antigen/teichoic acid export membrane protein